MKPTQFLYFDALQTWTGHGARPRPSQLVNLGPAYLYRPGRDVRRRLWPYPSRPMLGIVLLLGACFMVACWNARTVPVSDAATQGINLRVAAESPKVNTTSVTPPPLPPPAAALHKEPEKSIIETPSLLPAWPVRNRRAEFLAAPKIEVLPSVEVKPPPVAATKPPVEITPPPVVEVSQPLVPVVFYGPGSLTCSCFNDSPRGDTPMMRNWTVLKVSSVMAVALAAAPAVAGPTEFQPDTKTEEKLRDIDKKLDSLKDVGKQLKELSEALNSMGGLISADMKSLNDRLKKLQEATDDTAVRLSGTQSRLELLEKKVSDLRADLSKLQGNSGISLYPPEKAALDAIMQRLIAIEAALAKGSAPSVSLRPPNTGRIELVNMYGEEMLFVVNGKAYRVAPYTTLMLDNQSAGAFSYEVISGTYGVRARNTPTLLPGDTYTITVR